MTEMYYRDRASKLAALGYEVVPIAQGLKHPGLPNWQSREFNGTEAKHASKGVGVKGSSAVGIDLDIRDQDLAGQMQAFVFDLLGEAPVRIGQAPKTLLVYRPEGEFPRIQSKAYKDEKGNKHQVEAIAEGFQWVAYHTHPDTGQPYTWPGVDLLDAPLKSLPSVTVKQFQIIVDEFERLANEKWQSGGGKASKPAATQSEPMEGFEGLQTAKETDGAKIDAALKTVDASDYKTWVDIGKALYDNYDGGSDGYEKWVAWSATAPNYDEKKDLTKKWQSFKPSNYSKKRITIATLFHYAKSPYEQWRSRWAHVRALGKMWEFTTKTLCSVQSWRESEAHNFDTFHNDKGAPKEVPWTSRFLKQANDPDSQPHKLRTFQMMPNKPPIMGDAINLWSRPPALDLAPMGDPKGRGAELFLMLIERICSDRPEVVEEVLKWMATGLFRPDLKIRYALLLISDTEGLGKGFISRILAMLYGPDMSSEGESLDRILGRFGGSVLGNKMLCVVPELAENGEQNRFTAIEKLKSFVSDDRMPMEGKGRDAVMVDNFLRFLFSSNHLDGLKLSPKDRRFYVVVAIGVSALAPEIYAELDRLLTEKPEQTLADISAMLKQHVVEGAFPANAPPSDRQEVLDAFTDDWAKDLVKEYGGKQAGFTAAMLQAYAQSKGCNPPPTAKHIKRIMSDLGWKMFNIKSKGGRFYSDAESSVGVQLVDMYGEDFA